MILKLAELNDPEVVRLRSELKDCHVAYKAQIAVAEELKEDIRTLRSAVHEAGEVARRKEQLITTLYHDLLEQQQKIAKILQYVEPSEERKAS